jgi:hypothetical protein
MGIVQVVRVLHRVRCGASSARLAPGSGYSAAGSSTLGRPADPPSTTAVRDPLTGSSRGPYPATGMRGRTALCPVITRDGGHHVSCLKKVLNPFRNRLQNVRGVGRTCVDP